MNTPRLMTSLVSIACVLLLSFFFFQALVLKWKWLSQCTCGKDDEEDENRFQLAGVQRWLIVFVHVCLCLRVHVSRGTANLCVSPLQLSGKSDTSLSLLLSVIQRKSRRSWLPTEKAAKSGTCSFSARWVTGDMSNNVTLLFYFVLISVGLP